LRNNIHTGFGKKSREVTEKNFVVTGITESHGSGRHSVSGIMNTSHPTCRSGQW